MTTNNAPAIDTRITDAIADFILKSDDLDISETLEIAATILTATAFRNLCAALDACPTHLSDLDTCRDDELHCYDD